MTAPIKYDIPEEYFGTPIKYKLANVTMAGINYLPQDRSICALVLHKITKTNYLYSLNPFLPTSMFLQRIPNGINFGRSPTFQDPGTPLYGLGTRQSNR